MWQYNYMDYKNDFLAHHGIKGQKWGARRFEDYDGRLTQAGLKRYRAASQARMKAEQAYQNAAKKNALNPSIDNENNLRDKRLAYKNAKRAEKKSYKDLKLDNRADKGKRLLESGKTITGNKAIMDVTAAIGGTLSAVGMVATQGLAMAGKMNELTANIVSGGIAVGALATMGAVKIVKENENKNMRAYYYRTSRK